MANNVSNAWGEERMGGGRVYYAFTGPQESQSRPQILTFSHTIEAGTRRTAAHPLRPVADLGSLVAIAEQHSLSWETILCSWGKERE